MSEGIKIKSLSKRPVLRIPVQSSDDCLTIKIYKNNKRYKALPVKKGRDTLNPKKITVKFREDDTEEETPIIRIPDISVPQIRWKTEEDPLHTIDTVATTPPLSKRKITRFLPNIPPFPILFPRREVKPYPPSPTTLSPTIAPPKPTPAIPVNKEEKEMQEKITVIRERLVSLRSELASKTQQYTDSLVSLKAEFSNIITRGESSYNEIASQCDTQIFLIEAFVDASKSDYNQLKQTDYEDQEIQDLLATIDSIIENTVKIGRSFELLKNQVIDQKRFFEREKKQIEIIETDIRNRINSLSRHDQLIESQLIKLTRLDSLQATNLAELHANQLSTKLRNELAKLGGLLQVYEEKVKVYGHSQNTSIQNLRDEYQKLSQNIDRQIADYTTRYEQILNTLKLKEKNVSEKPNRKDHLSATRTSNEFNPLTNAWDGFIGICVTVGILAYVNSHIQKPLTLESVSPQTEKTLVRTISMDEKVQDLIAKIDQQELIVNRNQQELHKLELDRTRIANENTTILEILRNTSLLVLLIGMLFKAQKMYTEDDKSYSKISKQDYNPLNDPNLINIAAICIYTITSLFSSNRLASSEINARLYENRVSMQEQMVTQINQGKQTLASNTYRLTKLRDQLTTQLLQLEHSESLENREIAIQARIDLAKATQQNRIDSTTKYSELAEKTTVRQEIQTKRIEEGFWVELKKLLQKQMLILFDTVGSLSTLLYLIPVALKKAIVISSAVYKLTKNILPTRDYVSRTVSRLKRFFTGR